MGAVLVPAEQRSLAEHEAVIERGLASIVDAGNSLVAIRDGRLYRADFGTFEDYCRERWGFSYQRAHQLISAASVVSTIVETGLPAPTNEGQARELARVPEPERAEVWRETVERTNGRPTAAAIRDTYQPPPDPEPAPLPEGQDEADAIVARIDLARPQRRQPVVVMDREAQLESERRAAITNLRSVLTYLTSVTVAPEALARQYTVALDEFKQDDLDFAAAAMAAIAALKGGLDG